MGWWATDQGTIGDGPADRIAEALDAAPAAPVAILAGAFSAALQRNPVSFVADPSAASQSARVFWSDGRETVAAEAEPDLVDVLHAAIEAATLDYLDSPLARRPTVAELFDTLSFVVRPRAGGDPAAGHSLLDRISPEVASKIDDELRVVLGKDCDFRNVAAAVAAAGFVRDANAVPQDQAAPAFASWTAADRREIDYHADDDVRWLEIRGRDAGVLAGRLAAALDGRIARNPDAALAERITVPRGAGPAGLSATGTLRWAVLRQAIAAAVPENARAVNVLISAGLADPDWRVRMTAVLAVGRLRLAALAGKALAAPVPATGSDGLGQEDRRMLLALRQAAHDRAAGIPPHGEAADPAIAAKRQGFQARLQSRLAELPDAIEDRADALLLALLGGRAALNGRVPGAWRRWLDEPVSSLPAAR